MRRAVAAGGAAVLVLAGLAWWFSVDPEPVEVALPGRTERPRPRPAAPLPVPEPEPEVDDRPDTAIPEGADWGRVPETPEEEAQWRRERAAVKKELWLPEPIVERYGEWDGYTMRPERIGRIEDLTHRPVEPETLAELEELWTQQNENAALAVGNYRLGRLDESQTVERLDQAETEFRQQARELLGLSESQFDEVFGLGSL